VRQAAERNFGVELDRIKALCEAATTVEQLREIRTQIKAWDAPTPFAREAKDAYNQATDRVDP
jgi:hypothetical protein